MSPRRPTVTIPTSPSTLPRPMIVNGDGCKLAHDGRVLELLAKKGEDFSCYRPLRDSSDWDDFEDHVIDAIEKAFANPSADDLCSPNSPAKGVDGTSPTASPPPSRFKGIKIFSLSSERPQPRPTRGDIHLCFFQASMVPEGSAYDWFETFCFLFLIKCKVRIKLATWPISSSQSTPGSSPMRRSSSGSRPEGKIENVRVSGVTASFLVLRVRGETEGCRRMLQYKAVRKFVPIDLFNHRRLGDFIGDWRRVMFKTLIDRILAKEQEIIYCLDLWACNRILMSKINPDSFTPDTFDSEIFQLFSFINTSCPEHRHPDKNKARTDDVRFLGLRHGLVYGAVVCYLHRRQKTRQLMTDIRDGILSLFNGIFAAAAGAAGGVTAQNAVTATGSAIQSIINTCDSHPERHALISVMKEYLHHLNKAHNNGDIYGFTNMTIKERVTDAPGEKRRLFIWTSAQVFYSITNNITLEELEINPGEPLAGFSGFKICKPDREMTSTAPPQASPAPSQPPTAPSRVTAPSQTPAQTTTAGTTLLNADFGPHVAPSTDSDGHTLRNVASSPITVDVGIEPNTETQESPMELDEHEYVSTSVSTSPGAEWHTASSSQDMIAGETNRV